MLLELPLLKLPFCWSATLVAAAMLLPGLFPEPKREERSSIAVKAADDPISLEVLKKFLISETNMYIVNFLRFLGTNSLM